jgi:hypothetical protein
LVEEQHRTVLKQLIAGQAYRTVSAAISVQADPTPAQVCLLDKEIFHGILMREAMHSIGKRGIVNVAENTLDPQHVRPSLTM